MQKKLLTKNLAKQVWKHFKWYTWEIYFKYSGKPY